jgi:hypothetical protein
MAPWAQVLPRIDGEELAGCSPAPAAFSVCASSS